MYALAGAYGPVNVAQGPLAWIRNCEIYTTESVNIPGPFEIFAGADDPATFRSDVCSVGTATIGGNAAGATVPVTAPAQADVAVVAPTINLARASKTSECVYDTAAAGALNIAADVSVPCPVQTDADLSGMPTDIGTAIPFPTITPGATDYTVGPGQTLSLNPGNYGRIVLEANATLQLALSGNYHFRSIQTSTRQIRSYITVLSERVNILVKEYMLLGHRTQVNPADTRLLRIYVEGDDTIPAGWDYPAGFTYRGDGYFNACYVYSPNATQSWRGKPLNNGAYRTQSFGKAFFEDTLTAKFRVTMEHPQDEECFKPEFTCASIGRVTPGMSCNSATGEVKILSWSAGEKSLSYLLFFDEGASIPIYPSVNALRDAACLEFKSTELTYDPLNQVENAIKTPNIWTAGVLANCGDPKNLVPMVVGPVDPENGPGYPPVCYNAYTYDRLGIASPDTCTIVRP